MRFTESPEESHACTRLSLPKKNRSLAPARLNRSTSLLSSWLLQSNTTHILTGIATHRPSHLLSNEYGWLLNGKHNISYYLFATDDKYFIHSDDGSAYLDSGCYRKFYATLPQLDSIPKNYDFQHATSDVFLLLSRQQYGHFLYDDLLPLVTHLIITNQTTARVNFLYSKQWQRRLVHEIFRICKLKCQIQEQKLLPFTHKLTLNGKIVLAAYPNVACDWSTLFPWKNFNGFSDRPSNVYLSREKFDRDCQRLYNREALNRLLYDHKFFHVYPELLEVNEIVNVLSSSTVVLADPGTTPLIAGIFSPRSTPIIVLQSGRTVTDCTEDYAYSGWKYHTPWVNQFQYVYCKPVSPGRGNPFSDELNIPITLLADRIRSLL